jgi:hypothetical protein
MRNDYTALPFNLVTKQKGAFYMPQYSAILGRELTDSEVQVEVFKEKIKEFANSKKVPITTEEYIPAGKARATYCILQSRYGIELSEQWEVPGLVIPLIHALHELGHILDAMEISDEHEHYAYWDANLRTNMPLVQEQEVSAWVTAYRIAESLGFTFWTEFHAELANCLTSYSLNSRNLYLYCEAYKIDTKTVKYARELLIEFYAAIGEVEQHA